MSRSLLRLLSIENKHSFVSVEKWDPSQRKKILQKLWLKPENSLNNIYKTKFGAVENGSQSRNNFNPENNTITMITLGRTPKHASKKINSDTPGRLKSYFN
jgi:hypothetical protein